jgi:hypothetical protein
MNNFFKVTLALASFSAIANTHTFNGLKQPSGVKIEKAQLRGSYVHHLKFELNQVEMGAVKDHNEFQHFSEKNITFSNDVGSPSLPFKSVVVLGKPNEIQVTLDLGEEHVIPALAAPSQEEDCRCETQKTKRWLSSGTDAKQVRIDSLGKYRGQDLSRVTIMAARTNFSTQSTSFYPSLQAQIVSKGSPESMFASQTGAADYLIVSPEEFLPGLVEFVEYKTRQGHHVKVVKLEDIGSDVKVITDFFKEEYKKQNYKYALIVGNDTKFPNHQVSTSGSFRTPSDYPYFLMDDADMIPDVHYGRIVAGSVEEVERQTAKWMDYQNRQSPAAQYLHMIGIASNEGSNPSDEDYVSGIEKNLKTGFGTEASHFHQDSSTSKPKFINEAFNKGAGFLVYMGHGSGKAWASTGQDYDVASIKEMDNARELKPLIIDVACQNGILKKGYFGETFMNAVNAQNEAIGAAMYYGGSVNISWHPPAIMAQGLVKQTIAQNLDKVGDILLAGHLHLLENYTDKEAVRDNFEWFHLFGEPSSSVFFK